MFQGLRLKKCARELSSSLNSRTFSFKFCIAMRAQKTHLNMPFCGTSLTSKNCPEGNIPEGIEAKELFRPQNEEGQKCLEAIGEKHMKQLLSW